MNTSTTPATHRRDREASAVRGRGGRALATLALVLGIALVPARADAVVNTITFDGIPAGIECDEVWQEAGIDLYYTATTSEDCDLGGNCQFADEPGVAGLFPARVVIDLGETYDVPMVEVDWRDSCGDGCTQAFVYDGEATVATAQNTVTGEPETVTLTPSGGQADRVALSSCEGEILEVRITTDTVAAEATTLTSIKALYE